MAYSLSEAICRPERLLEAYRHGIFPWYSDDQPILWWSPDPTDRSLSRQTPYLAQPEEKPSSRPIQRHARPVLS